MSLLLNILHDKHAVVICCYLISLIGHYNICRLNVKCQHKKINEMTKSMLLIFYLSDSVTLFTLFLLTFKTRAGFLQQQMSPQIPFIHTFIHFIYFILCFTQDLKKDLTMLNAVQPHF